MIKTGSSPSRLITLVFGISDFTRPWTNVSECQLLKLPFLFLRDSICNAGYEIINVFFTIGSSNIGSFCFVFLPNSLHKISVNDRILKVIIRWKSCHAKHLTVVSWLSLTPTLFGSLECHLKSRKRVWFNWPRASLAFCVWQLKPGSHRA